MQYNANKFGMKTPLKKNRSIKTAVNIILKANLNIHQLGTLIASLK